VIAGAVSGSANQPKNHAESDRWLKSGTKSGISVLDGNRSKAYFLKYLKTNMLSTKLHGAYFCGT
jgi:hypothetical protein